MSDEVQKIRKRLQELRELHFTGFVNDAQFAESKTVLERKLVDAVMRQAEEAAEAQFAPTMMMDPAALPGAAAVLAPQRAWPRWLPWVVAAVLVHLAVAAGWWWSGAGSSSAAAVASTSAAEAAPPQNATDTAAVIGSVPAAPSAASGISGIVTLAPALAQQVGADDTVFVFARAIDEPSIPLAVIRKQVKDLPLSFTLDDSMASWPSARVSAFPQVLVIARVSKSGEGQPRKGDLQGQSPLVAAGAAGLQIEIGSVVE